MRDIRSEYKKLESDIRLEYKKPEIVTYRSSDILKQMGLLKGINPSDMQG